MTVRSTHAWENVPAILTRILVWVTLLAVLYILRSFFLLIFLTFIFAYIQANGVRRLNRKIRSRTVCVVLVALAFLSALTSIGAFLVPRVKEQAQLLADKYPVYLRTLDAEYINLAQSYPIVQQLFPLPESALMDAQHENWNPRTSPSAQLFQQLVGVNEGSDNGHNVKQTFDVLRDVGGYLGGIVSAFFLSLLFSFLIVLDLPKLAAGVRSLRMTKLSFAYEEVGDNIARFGETLGRAFEAQLLIALLNTFLTAIGIYVLGIGEQIAFLSVIVFFCSFIPVAGVFISSIPICILALQEAGIGGMFLGILLITGIHMVEAYILNPRIYGAHLRMNPVVVLIILTVAGKLFHIWGLILGVPVCTYIFGHAIQYHASKESGVVERLHS